MPKDDVAAIRKALTPRIPLRYNEEGRRRTGRYSVYVPYDPTVNLKQAVFLGPIYTPVREVLFGGAAGGGKSIGILMGACQYLDVPGYSALLLRRKWKELKLREGLIQKAHEWFSPTDAHWNAADRVYTFPTSGTPSSITFGHLNAERNKYDYLGSAFQYIGFDELTQYTYTQYMFLFRSLRKPTVGPLSRVPLRMRAGTNPGGEGHEWVRARFIEPWYEGGFAKDTAFLPSFLKDNPFLDYESYVESFSHMDRISRAQQLGGDWDIRSSGGYFDRSAITERGQLVNDGELPDDIRWIRYWDLAATKHDRPSSGMRPWTAGVKMGIRQSTGECYVGHCRRAQENPGEIERLIKATAASDGTDVSIRMEQEGGASGKNTIYQYAKVLRGYDFRGHNPSGDKLERARPFSAYWNNGLVWVVRGSWNELYFDELEACPEGAMDQVDASSGAFSCLAFSEDEGEEPYPEGVDLTDLVRGLRMR